MTTANKREQIRQSLSDYEYRHQFVEEEINVGIAFQIRSLRNRQNLKQSELANKMGVKQPLISSWENLNQSTYTIATLKGLAKAFDVGLLVRFVPFSKLADLTAELTPDDIAPPSFSEEQRCTSPFVPTSASDYNYIEVKQTPNANNPIVGAPDYLSSSMVSSYITKPKDTKKDEKEPAYVA